MKMTTMATMMATMMAMGTVEVTSPQEEQRKRWERSERNE
jgi:hypothetical protein